MNTIKQMPTLEIRSCRTCGSEVRANFKYCRVCGASQTAAPTSHLSMEDKLVSETGTDRDTAAPINNITVILADDHFVVRQECSQFLAKQPQIEIAGEAASGAEAAALSQEFVPDVALIDLMMPGIGACEAARQVKPVSPRTQIIIL